jgi:NifU-like protein involved in Fe-S cluster formation
VADVEELGGQAIVTPQVPNLDAQRWEYTDAPAGHGYQFNLETLEQKWIGLENMTRQERFYESPALIGCCMAISRDLYDKLWGFDPGMRAWGTEDVDLGLKAWLMGHPVLHDPEAIIGHVFQSQFDRYAVPEADALMNHLRLARKNFSDRLWHNWLERFRSRHPAGLWAEIWSLFQQERDSVERERAYLLNYRVHSEYWYAHRFGLNLPGAVTGGRHLANGTRGAVRDLLEQHQLEPRNNEAMADAQLAGIAETPNGGQLHLYLKLSRARSGIVSIQRASFQANGCDEAIPHASWLTERLRGMPVDGARQLQPKDLLQVFDRGNSNGHSANGHSHANGLAISAGKAESEPAQLVIAALEQALQQL